LDPDFPALIDDLRGGKLDDSQTGALPIEVLPSGKSDRRGADLHSSGRNDVSRYPAPLAPMRYLPRKKRNRKMAENWRARQDSNLRPQA
jgi:hypothetical protein